MCVILMVSRESLGSAPHTTEHDLEVKVSVSAKQIAISTLVQVLQGRGAFIDLKQWVQFRPWVKRLRWETKRNQ